MVTKVHEAMHTSVMAYLSGQPMAMGLPPAVDVEVLGASRYAHRLKPNFQKEADSSLGPAINDPWPATISISKQDGRKAFRTCLSAQLPPNNPRLVVLKEASPEQKKYYSGYKKKHGFKYQGIVTPDGMIGIVSSYFPTRTT
jgi:hypothetical protein